MASPQLKWALWASVTLLSFTALETHALRTHEPSGTLSEAVRAVIGVHPRSWQRWLLVPMFVGFLVWFGVHILSEPVHSEPWER